VLSIPFGALPLPPPAMHDCGCDVRVADALRIILPRHPCCMYYQACARLNPFAPPDETLLWGGCAAAWAGGISLCTPISDASSPKSLHFVMSHSSYMFLVKLASLVAASSREAAMAAVKDVEAGAPVVGAGEGATPVYSSDRVKVGLFHHNQPPLRHCVRVRVHKPVKDGAGCPPLRTLSDIVESVTTCLGRRRVSRITAFDNALTSLALSGHEERREGGHPVEGHHARGPYQGQGARRTHQALAAWNSPFSGYTHFVHFRLTVGWLSPPTHLRVQGTKPVLSGVSGELKAGEITAIMVRCCYLNRPRGYA
jgi:hypothetical protein